MRLVSSAGAFGLLVLVIGFVACSSPKTPSNTGSNQSGVVCGTEVCSAHASCDGTSCVCDAGFEKLGTICVDINECLINHGDCDSHASCVNTPGAFECKCRFGYEGDGTYCYEAGTDGGDQGPCGRCDPNATCEVDEETQEGTCVCNEGFNGNGRRCTDINECAENDCDINATCTNLPGTRACSCNAGFYGDGKKCNVGTDHSVGASCATPGQQSDCDSGLTCKTLSPTSLTACSKSSCSANSDCGKNGALQNICLSPTTGAPKECLRVCDPTNPASCGRQGLVCAEQHIGTRTYNLCTPDCRLDPTGSACSYGSSCGASTGVCEKKSCASSSCGAGEVCVTESNEKLCVPDCRVADNCSSNRECNAQTGGCEVPKHGYYEGCGTNLGECMAGFTCVVFASGDTDGLCLQNCSLDRDCNKSPVGMSSVCGVSVTQSNGSSQGVCVIDCSLNFSCPSGTTCTPYGWIDEFCFP